MTKKITLLAIALLLVSGACMVSCGSSESQVAATVNGEEISEELITDYITGFISQQGYNEEQWGQYLDTQEMTEEEFREDIIDYYVTYLLFTQVAEEEGISVSQTEVDSEISSIRESYGYTDDESWDSFLTSVGYADEAAYNNTIYYNLLIEKVFRKKVDEPTYEEEDLAAYVTEHVESYYGKHTRSIALSDSDMLAAQEVLDSILEAEDPVEAFYDNLDKSIYADAVSESGNMGWSSIESYGTIYSELVTDMVAGEVYGYLVQEGNAYHIVYCDEEYMEATYDESGLVDLSDMPASLLDTVTQLYVNELWQEACSDWLLDLKDSADVVINSKPSNINYVE